MKHKIDINLKKENVVPKEDWRLKAMEEEKKTCSNCKKKNTEIIALCSGFHLNFGFLAGYRLCNDCINKCPKCKKYYCPKHIKNHKCK